MKETSICGKITDPSQWSYGIISSEKVSCPTRSPWLVTVIVKFVTMRSVSAANLAPSGTISKGTTRTVSSGLTCKISVLSYGVTYSPSQSTCTSSSGASEVLTMSIDWQMGILL